MFEQPRSVSLGNAFAYIALAVLAGAAGYLAAKHHYHLPDVQLQQTERGAMISYKNSEYRPISATPAGSVVVGTLPQRLEDLLDENPSEIRRQLEHALRQK